MPVSLVSRTFTILLEQKITDYHYLEFRNEKWQLVIHFVDVPLVDSFLDIGQTADVQRRVWQGGMHPRQSK
jgi:hypothetical protein